MVLTSQAPRPGARQLYMTSRRRRFRKWPWAIVIACAMVFLLYRLMTTGSSEAPPPDGSAVAAIDDATPDAEPVRPAPPTRTADLPPPEVVSPPEAHGLQSMGVAVIHHNDQTPAPELYPRGMKLIAEGKFVEGRAVLSQLLFNHNDLRLRPADAQVVRDTLTSVNQKLVFDNIVVPNDPVAEAYIIKSGDVLTRIAPKYHTPAMFIQQINDVDPRRLHVGKKLKVIRGPFHVRIIKHDYRLDLYLKDDSSNPLYVMSMMVGLGEAESTPVGHWVIEPGRKVKNPEWRNPQTNEYYAPNDPNNPIGEYWLALKGIDPTTENLKGYGIHGTVDPQSIGSQVSMGCIRLRDNDIEMIFGMLSPGKSTVQILP